ncbi:MAG: OmpA family protein [Bacteroidota bacterium]
MKKINSLTLYIQKEATQLQLRKYKNRPMKYYLFFCLIGIVVMASCVSTRRYDEMRGAKDYWESEADQADSLRQELSKIEEKMRQTNKQLEESYHEQEQLEATNMNLSRNYQRMLVRYEDLVGQDTKIYENLSLERKELNDALSAERALLDQRERELRELDHALRQRQAALAIANTSVDNIQGQLQEREQRIQQLLALLERQGQDMQGLGSKIGADFKQYNTEELQVSNQNGKIRLALSEELLFTKSSHQLNARGRTAVQQLAKSIGQQPDLNILVEGHTDTDGTSAYNLDLSAKRAIAVAKVLMNTGVSPTKITASGKGEYHPIAPNTTENGKAKNRRVEIILSPDEAAIWKTIEMR